MVIRDPVRLQRIPYDLRGSCMEVKRSRKILGDPVWPHGKFRHGAELTGRLHRFFLMGPVNFSFLITKSGIAIKNVFATLPVS